MPNWFWVLIWVSLGVYLILNFFCFLGTCDDNYFTNKENWRKLKDREITFKSCIETSTGRVRGVWGRIGDKVIVHYEDGRILLDNYLIDNWTMFSFGMLMSYKYKSLRKEIIRKIRPIITKNLEANGTKAALEEYKSFI